MDICKFEIRYGDPDRVNGIYWQAVKNLNPDLVGYLNSEFALIRTEGVPEPPPEFQGPLILQDFVKVAL